MKKIHFVLFAIAMLIVLSVYAKWRLKETGLATDSETEMTYENLFVSINSDTLIYYLNDFKENHPSLSIRDNSHEIIVEHNKHALILLNVTANDMPKEREMFANGGIITDKDDKTVLRLAKSKINSAYYVECPAPILAEILRLKNLKSKKDK